ncbi:hypothetical protein DFS34DRAFT_144868 [Phlyctochytrium arcticum]|nr:hypothetical protein DFS34DRAFT_144868 [Phlyctochytrium arcticum]
MIFGHRNCLLVVLALFLCYFSQSVEAANTTVFCKCVCAPNSAIKVVQDCSHCTKNFCEESGICVLPALPPLPTTTTLLGTETPGISPTPTLRGDENWEVQCYQLGSYKDEFIIYSFIIIVISLLVVAATKPYTAFFFKDRWSQRTTYSSVQR